MSTRPIPEEVIALAAQAAHEVNRTYCLALGDNSQRAWDDAPTWQRESAISGVRFQIDNPDAPPSASHEFWLQAKAADGWTYGSVKSLSKREHPCMVPYDQLPLEQQIKDQLFVTTVRGVLGHYTA
jgi:hypothetical protein